MAIHALVYFLSMYGMAWIICYGKISLPIRQYFYNNKDSTPLYFLYELTKCPVCTSWWLALATLLTGIPQYIFNYQYNKNNLLHSKLKDHLFPILYNMRN